MTPPGIDPGTVPLVAQCLNHYATPGPASGWVLSSIRTLTMGTKVVYETLVYWRAWRGCRSKSTWLNLVTVKQQYICNTDHVVVCILFHLQESIWLILTIYDFTKSAPVTLLPVWRVCVCCIWVQVMWLLCASLVFTSSAVCELAAFVHRHVWCVPNRVWVIRDVTFGSG